MERNTRQLSRGYAAVFATVGIWSLPSLFLFYLNRFYDPWSQNFYRYAVACLAIVPFVLFQFRRGPKIDMRAVGLCLIPCLPNVVHQITQVVALFYMGPGVYAIFARTSVIFTALLALAFFPEERYLIRQWQFQLGTLLGLLGAFGVIWFQSNGEDRWPGRVCSSHSWPSSAGRFTVCSLNVHPPGSVPSAVLASSASSRHYCSFRSRSCSEKSERRSRSPPT